MIGPQLHAGGDVQMCSEFSSWRLKVLSQRLADLAAEVSHQIKRDRQMP